MNHSNDRDITKLLNGCSVKGSQKGVFFTSPPNSYCLACVNISNVHHHLQTRENLPQKVNAKDSEKTHAFLSLSVCKTKELHLRLRIHIS